MGRQTVCKEEEILKAAGLRSTEPRRAVLSHLGKTRYPLSIKTLHKALPDLDIVTLYRTVETLQTKGIVARIDLKHRHAHYELAQQTDHHHIVCIKCDRVEDFEGCGAEKIINRALKQVRGFARITNHSFELFGICTACFKSYKHNLSLV